jgi:hypothetical protein
MNIKDKIWKNKLTITRADKVILTQEEYKYKIRNFIQNNHFIMIIKNPTQ